jgi:hypothetical protein
MTTSSSIRVKAGPFEPAVSAAHLHISTQVRSYRSNGIQWAFQKVSMLSPAGYSRPSTLFTWESEAKLVLVRAIVNRESKIAITFGKVGVSHTFRDVRFSVSVVSASRGKRGAESRRNLELPSETCSPKLRFRIHELNRGDYYACRKSHNVC